MDYLNNKYQGYNFCIEELTLNRTNIKKGLGCNLPYRLNNYLKQKIANNELNFDIFNTCFSLDRLSDNNKLSIHQKLEDVLAYTQKNDNILTSYAHPPRTNFCNRITKDFEHHSHYMNKNPAEEFFGYFLPYLYNNGLQAMEYYYGGFNKELKEASKYIFKYNSNNNPTENWIHIFYDFCNSNNIIKTGGYDNHNHTILYNEKNELMSIWQDSKEVIAKGYKALGKEFAMSMPAPCMPAGSKDKDVGIGSAYGDGAKRVWSFFEGVVEKILLGPAGKTNKESGHSPYMSEKAHNPFFIPLEKLVRDNLLDHKILQTIYDMPKEDNIDFEQVEKAFNLALNNFSDEQIEELAIKYIHEVDYNYIGDIQVKIPHSIYMQNPSAFLEGFSLGVPADILNPKPRDWGFAVLNPAKMFNKNGSLGDAGKILYDIFYQSISANKGGMRIDHFIGMVNPFVVSHNPNVESGRLYSSPDHPIFKEFAKHSVDEFANITTDIILKAAKEKNVDKDCLYIEDIGARPIELDLVIDKCKLGRLLISQFVEIDDDNHIYRLKNANETDVASVDTHDTMSIHDFYKNIDEHNRYMHALKLSQDLRFCYNDNLKSTSQLIRMKWGELLTCPAQRVQGFFTSILGQEGRYNQPGNPIKWKLRCNKNFEDLYFCNLLNGTAYNPYDAICLAIYARGDEFFEQHKELINTLREFEDLLLKKAKEIYY